MTAHPGSSDTRPATAGRNREPSSAPVSAAAEATGSDEPALWRGWFAAAGAPTVDAALRAVFGRLDQQVRRRGLTCQLSGRCCRFDQFGHRLYVTGLELAWVLTQIGKASGDDRPAGAGVDAGSWPTLVDPTGPCVFQVGNRCGVHAVRPLGCRVFFCQADTDRWQHELYERSLADLRRLHGEHDLPYRYMEWRHGLARARASRLT